MRSYCKYLHANMVSPWEELESEVRMGKNLNRSG